MPHAPRKRTYKKARIRLVSSVSGVQATFPDRGDRALLLEVWKPSAIYCALSPRTDLHDVNMRWEQVRARDGRGVQAWQHAVSHFRKTRSMA